MSGFTKESLTAAIIAGFTEVGLPGYVNPETNENALHKIAEGIATGIYNELSNPDYSNTCPAAQPQP